VRVPNLPLHSDSAPAFTSSHWEYTCTRLVCRATLCGPATALHHNLVLVTGNTALYQRLQALGYDLRLDDWRAE